MSSGYTSVLEMDCDICGKVFPIGDLWRNDCTGNITCAGCKGRKPGPGESRKIGDCQRDDCRARRVPLYPNVWEGTGSITWLCGKCAGGPHDRSEWDAAKHKVKKYSLHKVVADSRLNDVKGAEPARRLAA